MMMLKTGTFVCVMGMWLLTWRHAACFSCVSPAEALPHRHYRLTAMRSALIRCHVEQGEGASHGCTATHVNRRQLLKHLPALAVSVATSSLIKPAVAAAAASDSDLVDGRWWIFPLAPYQRKKTVRTEAVLGQVWTFDQIIGALYVHVPLRMTVVKLSSGGLLAFSPVNPTPECLALVRDLENLHGDLKFVVLGSAAIEHKVAAGPFARAFPKAQLWVAPDQYSYPFDWDNVGRDESGLGRLDLTQLFFGLTVHPLPRSSANGDASESVER